MKRIVKFFDLIILLWIFHIKKNIASKLDYDDFKWGLRNGGLSLNNEVFFSLKIEII